MQFQRPCWIFSQKVQFSCFRQNVEVFLKSFFFRTLPKVILRTKNTSQKVLFILFSSHFFRWKRRMQFQKPWRNFVAKGLNFSRLTYRNHFIFIAFSERKTTQKVLGTRKTKFSQPYRNSISRKSDFFLLKSHKIVKKFILFKKIVFPRSVHAD